MYTFELNHKSTTSPKKNNSIQLDYQPVYNKLTSTELNIFPIFNTDKQLATPGFIMQCEIPSIELNLLKYEEQYSLRVEQSKQKQTQLNIPKPKHKTQFCSLCKQQYQDYLTHIFSKDHKKLMSSSIYMKKIKKIASTYKFQELRTQIFQNDNSIEETSLPIKENSKFDTDAKFRNNDSQKHQGTFTTEITQQRLCFELF